MTPADKQALIEKMKDELSDGGGYGLSAYGTGHNDGIHTAIGIVSKYKSLERGMIEKLEVLKTAATEIVPADEKELVNWLDKTIEPLTSESMEDASTREGEATQYRLGQVPYRVSSSAKDKFMEDACKGEERHSEETPVSETSFPSQLGDALNIESSATTVLHEAKDGARCPSAFIPNPNPQV